MSSTKYFEISENEVLVVYQSFENPGLPEIDSILIVSHYQDTSLLGRSNFRLFFGDTTLDESSEYIYDNNGNLITELIEFKGWGKISKRNKYENGNKSHSQWITIEGIDTIKTEYWYSYVNNLPVKTLEVTELSDTLIHTFIYDELNHLIESKTTNGVDTEVIKYWYDEQGKETRRHIDSYVYGVIKSVNEYDSRGNLIRESILQDDIGLATYYRYSSENQLVEEIRYFIEDRTIFD